MAQLAWPHLELRLPPAPGSTGGSRRRILPAAVRPKIVALSRPGPCVAVPRRQQQRQYQRQQAVRGPQSGFQLNALQVDAPSQAMGVEEAWDLLEEFTRREARGLAQPLLDSADKRQRLRDALLVAAGAPHAPAGWSPEASASAAAAAAAAPGDDGGDAPSSVPEVLMGVVASDVRLAVRSLRDYCQALGLPFLMPESRVPGAAAAPAITGPVYVKYNSATRLCYCTTYEGRDRGVLLQLGQRQLGHLPLGLHDEGMARPAVIG